MTFKPARLLIALLAFVALPVFAQNIAVVNGKAIPTSRFEAVLKQALAQGRPDSAQLRDGIKKMLIEGEVMAQEAEKQGFGKDAAVKAQLDNERQRIILNAVVEDFLKKNPVKDADVKAEYDRYVAQAGDKEYHVRHIIVDTEAEAKDIIAKLKAGAKFEDLAKLSKDVKSGANGGDIGWIMPSAPSIPPAFKIALLALQKGQVAELPVPLQDKFDVLKVEDIQAAKLPTLEEVKTQIVQSLNEKKLEAYQGELVKKAKIQK
jgi:peptidyl-prolyl cis-trans isomerase C